MYVAKKADLNPQNFVFVFKMRFYVAHKIKPIKTGFSVLIFFKMYSKCKSVIIYVRYSKSTHETFQVILLQLTLLI